MITRLDRDVGRLLDQLKELGPRREHASSSSPPTTARTGKAATTRVLQRLQRPAARHQARPARGRHPRADDRPLARQDQPGARRDHVGAFWDVLPTLAELAGGKDCPSGSTASPSCRRCWAEGQAEAARISTGSSTSAAPGRPCAWASGRRCSSRSTRRFDSTISRRISARRRNLADKELGVVAQLREYMEDAYAPSERWKFPPKRSRWWSVFWGAVPLATRRTRQREPDRYAQSSSRTVARSRPFRARSRSPPRVTGSVGSTWDSRSAPRTG